MVVILTAKLHLQSLTHLEMMRLQEVYRQLMGKYFSIYINNFLTPHPRVF